VRSRGISSNSTTDVSQLLFKMANGYVLPILQHITAMAGTNPARKLSPLGFLQMILSRMDDSVQWSQQYKDGHETSLKVKFRRRPLKSEVRDTESACDNVSNPSYEEFTVPGLLHREVSFYLSSSQIRQYTKDASQFVKLSTTDSGPLLERETSVMKEVYELFIEYGAVLLASINEALVTQMATSFGTNVVTGNANSRALSFSLGTVAMQDALIQLLTDWRENEFTDDVAIVGHGPFANMDLVKKFYSQMANQQGVNMASLASAIPNTWYDKDCKAIWGANQVGVFQKGAVHLLTRNRYEGNFAQRLAASSFFTMALPVNELTVPQPFVDRLKFDVQIKEIDCPTEVTVNGNPATVSEGVLVFLKKKFSLFTLPEMYKVGDPLAGTNGTLRYTITAS
jgi:hypothetical protein